MSAAAIRKIYVLHTLVQGAIFTRSSSGTAYTRGGNLKPTPRPHLIFTQASSNIQNKKKTKTLPAEKWYRDIRKQVLFGPPDVGLS